MVTVAEMIERNLKLERIKSSLVKISTMPNDILKMAIKLGILTINTLIYPLNILSYHFRYY